MNRTAKSGSGIINDTDQGIIVAIVGIGSGDNGPGDHISGVNREDVTAITVGIHGGGADGRPGMSTQAEAQSCQGADHLQCVSHDVSKGFDFWPEKMVLQKWKPFQPSVAEQRCTSSMTLIGSMARSSPQISLRDG